LYTAYLGIYTDLWLFLAKYHQKNVIAIIFK